jgi:hypothetical protein
MGKKSAIQAKAGAIRKEDSKNFIMIRSSRNCAQNIAKIYSFAKKKTGRSALAKDR